MPVTAKLSRKFYDRFGEDIVNELVEWFNLVDATYRSDLHALNEANYARFDAKLEQRVAELRAEFTKQIAELRVEMNERFAKLEAKIDAQLGGMRETMVTKDVLEKRLREQTGLFFAAWGILLASSIALWFR